jgi:flagellar hook-basal body complex protein FliE
MSTPIAAAANAYASIARMRDDTAKIAGGLGGAQESGPSFSTVLKDMINAVTETAQKSDVQAQAVAAGKANMIDVVTAVAETETTMQTLVSVRDKVIAAYEDVLKMPI